MGKNKIRLLVVDDDASITDALSVVLEHAGYAVLVARDGREALRRAFADQPALILLDVGLPGYDGFTVLDRLHEQAPDLPIIILTAYTQISDRVKGLDKGAVDYLTKPFNSEELLAHIRRRLREQRQRDARRDLHPVDSNLAIDFAAHRLMIGRRVVNLPPIEWRILRSLVENEGRTVTYERLAQAGWEKPEYGDQQAIKVRILHLRRKLGDRTRPWRYIHTDRLGGYRFDPPR